jgi:hypothetical protein
VISEKTKHPIEQSTNTQYHISMSSQLSKGYRPKPYVQKYPYKVGKHHYPNTNFRRQALETSSLLYQKANRLILSSKPVESSNENHIARLPEQNRFILKSQQFPVKLQHTSSEQEESLSERSLPYRSPSPQSHPQSHPVLSHREPEKTPHTQLELPLSNIKDISKQQGSQDASVSRRRRRRLTDTDGGVAFIRAILAHSHANLYRTTSSKSNEGLTLNTKKRATRYELNNERSDIEDWELAQQLFDAAKRELVNRL